MSEAWAGGSDTRWRRFRARILRLDLPAPMRPRCQIGYPGVCTDRATCVDHIIPLSRGGAKYAEDNARPACRECNTKRGAARAEVPDPPIREVSSW